jgi:hypothetical protein
MKTKIYSVLIVGVVAMVSCVNGLYFMMEEGSVKCFKDELVKSTVSIKYFLII